MNRETLMNFMQRILACGSVEKSTASLNQLKDILQKQHAGPDLINLINQTLRSIPEAKKAAKEPLFSEESLLIAIGRANDRIRREAEMANRGRC